MKLSRRKKVNRYMQYFRNHFGFREPYQLLIDGPFCFTALENKVSIREQLSKYLNCEVKLLTTQCVLHEMEKLGPTLYGALNVIKQFPIHKCGHERNPLPAAKCLESMISGNNPQRYIIVSQDKNMREIARTVPGTPILYLYGKAPTLEKPSSSSESLTQKVHDAKLQKSEHQLQVLRKLKTQELGEQVQEKKPRKRKAKGPNPLSCKKKKRKTDSSKSGNVAKKSVGDSTDNAEIPLVAKKKRKRIRIPAHVKQELSKNS